MKRILLFLSLFVISGCFNAEKINPIDSGNKSKDNDYTITVKEMLGKLTAYSGIQNATKVIDSFDESLIKEILVVGYPESSFLTKADSYNSDTLLYVVNLNDDQGYIIMAADRRIPESMLMFTESGNISISDFETVGGYVGADNTFIDTINIYDEKNDDYLIGGNPYLIEKYIIQEVQAYASLCVADFQPPITEIGDDNPYIIINGERVSTSYTWAERINCHKDTVISVEPLLKTRWSQGWPYNALIPNGHYTGCVVNAVGQIMAYEQFPQKYYAGGLYIDWETLTETTTISPDTPAANMVAALSRIIQYECHSMRFGGGTFTFPKYAENFMKEVGYTNVQRQCGYDTDLIANSLRKHHPVFLAGSDGWWLWDVAGTGHAWLVDGLRTIYEEYDLIDHNTKEYIKSEREFLWNHVHCVWGTSASWVVNGVFIKTDGTSYTDWKRMITYDI